MNIAIVDYGMGNISSIKKRLKQLNVTANVASKSSEIILADKIILPGIGHFGKAMENLKQLNLIEPLHQAVLINKKPILGICLGMQLMAAYSQEGNAKGLSWFDGDVIKFNIKDTFKFKIPHTGWNTIDIQQTNNPLIKNIASASEFYFVHAFHVQLKNANEALSTTTYDYNFTSAISKQNIFGVQFHPEKSHQAGLTMLSNFVNL